MQSPALIQLTGFQQCPSRHAALSLIMRRSEWRSVSDWALTCAALLCAITVGRLARKAVIALPAESPRADRNAILLSTTSYGGPLQNGSPEHKGTAWPLQSRREASRWGHACPLVAGQIPGMGCNHCAHLRRLI